MGTGKSHITALAFFPDISRIAAGYEYSCVRLWDVGSRDLLITMLGFACAEGQGISPDWIAHNPDVRYDRSPGVTSLIR